MKMAYFNHFKGSHKFIILYKEKVFFYHQLHIKCFLSMENIGMKIRKLRELRNYTQEYMALNLNITQTAYCKIEKEESRLTITRLKEISLVLEVDSLQLLTFDEKVFFSNLSSAKPVEKKIVENDNLRQIFQQDTRDEQMNHRIKQLENEIIMLKGMLINSQNSYFTAMAS